MAAPTVPSAMSSPDAGPQRPTFGPARPWLAPARIGAAVAAGTVLLGVGDPNTTHVPLCPLKAVSGLDCPACGSLRAVHGLAHLDVPDAFGHNALFTLLAPVLVVSWGIWLARSLGRPVLGDRRWPTWTGPALLGVALAFGVLRNLGPFQALGSA